MSRANPPRITYYVVLYPQPADSGGAIRPISRLLKIEEEQTREMLLTKTFQVLARYAKKPNAEGLQNQLGALGVDTVLMSDQDVRGHLFVYAATASKGAGGIAFRDFDEKPLYTPYEDIIGAVLMEIFRQDGSRATFIDLHRKSNNITPRIDTALFDFAALMGKDGAKLEDFLSDLETRCTFKVDRRYAPFRPQIIAASKDFGSRPMEFTPPDGKLPSFYLPEDQLAASIWSFLLYRKTASGE